MKHKLSSVDASPSKRLYLSIIADYDTKTALCELIDNAIDNWVYEGKSRKLKVLIDLDYERQLILISDNSGGIKEENIKLVISPGHTRNEGNDAIIGVFGVGSKRSVVALAEDVKITTRYRNKKTILVEFNDDWINDESWEIPTYTVNDIEPNTTKIQLIKLRSVLSEEDEHNLIDHLGATYALVLMTGDFELLINGKLVHSVTFDSWSFPPGYEPSKVDSFIDVKERGKIKVEFLAGLTKSGDPSGGEYGAYFYCNNRLFSRAYKGPEVGFRQMKIGQPHPSVSIARVIVKLTGPAGSMPWNSSKSDLNVKHPSFSAIQTHVEKLLVHYATLARNMSTSGGWPTTIFKYDVGEIKEQLLEDISTRILLPTIPRSVLNKYPQVIKQANKALAKDKPWTKGLYEAIIAVNELPRLHLEQNNRISLLLLDSTLEIAFKEYLVNESPNPIAEPRLNTIMANRTLVHTEIKTTTKFSKPMWKKIEYFYKIRCDLVHKRASATILDDDLKSFRTTVEYVLHKLFKIDFKTTKESIL